MSLYEQVYFIAQLLFSLLEGVGTVVGLEDLFHLSQGLSGCSCFQILLVSSRKLTVPEYLSKADKD